MSAPVYYCPKIERPLQLTGRLDDPLWQHGQAAPLREAKTGTTPRFATEARLVYDESHLYVGFHCVDDYIWGTHTAHESAIFSEECVEVFISPASTMHQYFEINVSPRNVVFDACILNFRTPEAPDRRIIGLTQFDPAGMRTLVQVEGVLNEPGQGRFWTAEYAIPFDQMCGAPHLPPRPGDEWRLNLYRIDSPRPKALEYYAWSTLDRIDFHRPWEFGTLRFVG